ncbi:PDZ domain-containing protein [Oscillospiraceae bacterium CM]|nr:PDZ domain-containing protein [Oscillospiraceae bacterium CM]
MKKQFGFKTVIALMLCASALTCLVLVIAAWLYTGADVGLFGEIRTYIAMRRDIKDTYIGTYDSQKVSEAALKATVDALDDKWSYYMTPSEYKKYQNDANNQYAGIGITVKKDDATGGLLVLGVTPGSAAEEAGLIAGDIITAIDGKDITKLSLHDASALFDRALGQSVSLTVASPDGSERTLSAVYALVDTKPVRSELIDGNVGYIEIKNFEGGTADSFIKAADELVAKGAQSFVFDVRNNGGGRVTELKKMLDYLLPECDIFIAVDKSGKEDVTRSDAENVKLPAVVLVNQYSYSAAEYFAAVLQEYKYATVVGQHTTGKNRSQVTLTLPDGGALHISSGEYVTPHRVSLYDAGGIAPDVPVDLSEADNALLYGGQLPRDKDIQLNKALDLLKQS